MQARDKESSGTEARGAWRRAAPAVLVLLAAACERDGAAGAQAPAAGRPGVAASAGGAAGTFVERSGPAVPIETTEPSPALAAEIAHLDLDRIAVFLSSPQASERRIAVRALGRVGGDAAAEKIAPHLKDADPSVRLEACFAIGVTGSELAAGLLTPVVEGTPSRDELAAIATGLGSCTDDAAAVLLLQIATRDEMPVEAPEAMFRHLRFRKTPAGHILPHDALLRYTTHPSPRGRAAIGWFGRVWKDARLLDPLVRLAGDPEPDVRRAVAFGLAEGKAEGVRPQADADRAVAALRKLADDRDARVVVATCRALGSYDRKDAVSVLEKLLAHRDFNVRVAAAEALGGRKAASAADALERLARTDASPSVRYAAATQLAQIDEKRATALAGDLLADTGSEYVRTAGAELFAKRDDPASVAKLAEVAASDPHVRVRQTALDGMKGKKGEVAFGAVRSALGGADPVLVAVAADVVATNEWKELLPDLRAAFARFPGTAGADAREGIVTALGKFAVPDDDPLIRGVVLNDLDGGPRLAARTILAARAGRQELRPDRKPSPSGAKVPGGAPLLAKDVDLVVETDRGTMRIRLDVANAPVHSSHVAHLASLGFYDGLTWHRVVPDFVVQGGCPRGDGAGNAGVTLSLEPTRTPFERGTLGMPRSTHPDTGGCQLFICHSRAPHLDVQYTAFGRVTEGLEVIDRIDVDAKIVHVRVEGVR